MTISQRGSDEAALEALASILFWEFEQRNPTGRFEMSHGRLANWHNLTDQERDLYVSALERTLAETELLIRAKPVVCRR